MILFVFICKYLLKSIDYSINRNPSKIRAKQKLSHTLDGSLVAIMAPSIAGNSPGGIQDGFHQTSSEQSASCHQHITSTKRIATPIRWLRLVPDVTQTVRKEPHDASYSSDIQDDYLVLTPHRGIPAKIDQWREERTQVLDFGSASLSENEFDTIPTPSSSAAASAATQDETPATV